MFSRVLARLREHSNPAPLHVTPREVGAAPAPAVPRIVDLDSDLVFDAAFSMWPAGMPRPTLAERRRAAALEEAERRWAMRPRSPFEQFQEARAAWLRGR